MNQGLIGAWSPGIGDPSVGGWLTTVLYVVASWACLQVLLAGRKQRLFLNADEKTIWRLLLITMVLLGFNKQLDVQSALTEIARIHAMEHNWYDQRRQIQEAFVASVPVVGLTALAALWVLAWKSPAQTLLSCTGTAGLVAFVAIRAVSLHDIDDMLGWQLAGLHLNWIIEMGSILVIGLGALLRIRARA